MRAKIAESLKAAMKAQDKHRLPTLRLIRVGAGPYELGDLESGRSRVVSVESDR